MILPIPLSCQSLTCECSLALPLATPAFENYVSDWLQMKETSGIIDKFYSKWILGAKTEQKKGYWSTGQNLFGWWQ